MPLARQVVDQLMDLDLGADVDAARRFVEDQHLGLRLQPLADDDLLLVAARERGAGVSTDGARMLSRWRKPRRPPLLGARDQPEATGSGGATAARCSRRSRAA